MIDLIDIISRLEVALVAGTQYMAPEHQRSLFDARAALVAAGRRPSAAPAPWRDRVDMFEGVDEHA